MGYVGFSLFIDAISDSDEDGYISFVSAGRTGVHLHANAQRNFYGFCRSDRRTQSNSVFDTRLILIIGTF